MPLLIAAGVGAAGSLISSGVQMYQGSQQEKAGKNAMKGLVAPTYEIPEELKKNLKESELRALEGLPTEQKLEYVRNIERSQQNRVQQSADRKAGLIGLQEASNEATDAFTRLTSMDAQARAENEQKVQQNRLAIAQAKDKQFGVKEDRYQQGLSSAQAMIGAGLQNQAQGLDQIGGTLISGASTLAIAGLMDREAKKNRDNAPYMISGDKIGKPLTKDQLSAADAATKGSQYINWNW